MHPTLNIPLAGSNSILIQLEVNKHINKSFKSFITQHSALPGMSGGPVFNLAGEIVGLTSANWTRKVQRNSQLHTNVENGIAVDLKEINEFLSQHLYKERIALA